MAHSQGRVMFSTAEESFGSAVRELRTVFGSRLEVERIGPDAGVLPADAPTVRELARACRTDLVFIRHLTTEIARVPAASADLATVGRTARSLVDRAAVGGSLAVQVWASGAPKIGYGSGELYARLAEDLATDRIEVTRSGQTYALSACIAAGGVSLGLNETAHSLVDWPGGRVRLARDPDRVSRAESKLEELFQVFPLRLPEDGRAVDLGASPGGWTRVLRRYGMSVWAVDPGDLDPRLTRDPRVRHARTTAGEFLRATDTWFDMAVNDMRMAPELSSRIMLDTAARLRPGALAVLTLKTGARQPVDTVRRCLSTLGSAYQVLFARQLHHNRHEVTVVARRNR